MNDEVVHGIPSRHRILKEGDIVSLDAGVIYKGYHSDAARTWGVGAVSPEAQKLMDVTKQAFFEGIRFAKAGNHLNDISSAIQRYAESFGYGVVRDLVGHGIGTHLHEDPEVPNFAMKRKGKFTAPLLPVDAHHLELRDKAISQSSGDVFWEGELLLRKMFDSFGSDDRSEFILRHADLKTICSRRRENFAAILQGLPGNGP